MNSILDNLTNNDYNNFYVWLIGCFVVFGSLILLALQNKPTISLIRNDRNILIFLITILILFAGTRAVNIGTDTSNYYNYFFLKGLHISNFFDFIKRLDTDFFFSVIMFLTFKFKSFTFFLLTVSLIMNIGFYRFVRKYTNYGESGSSLLLFLMITCSFVFLNYEINIIRNGLAIPFILFGLLYLIQKQYKIAALYLITSFFFHRTSLIPIGCLIMVLIGENVKIKYFIIAYVMAIGLAFLGFGFDKLPFLASLGGEDVKNLAFTGETTYRVGFRIDFVFYNSMFLFLFLKFGDLNSRLNVFLIKYFIVSSVVFYFNFNIPYSDRIGGYSWLAIPLLLFSTINSSFPKNKYTIMAWVTIFYYTFNHIILPLISGSGSSDGPPHHH